MAVKTYKPYTPSRRFMIWYDFSDITKRKPEKTLTKYIKKTGGRNNKGRITMRFRGGWHKQLYRIIDFKGYDKCNIPAKVASIEYDPYRTSRIVLLHFSDGEKRYVLARKGVAVGDQVMNGEKALIKPGNRKQLKEIPEWINIFNLELTPFTKGKLIKGAGLYATISGKDEQTRRIFVKLPSGELRKFDENCWATIGELGNEQHKNIVIGKAWRQRRKGKKPHVLGISMNPVDHPLGGWEGHSDIWLKKWPKSFSGKVVAAGIKTRRSKKRSTKFIASSRKKKSAQ